MAPQAVVAAPKKRTTAKRKVTIKSKKNSTKDAIKLFKQFLCVIGAGVLCELLAGAVSNFLNL